MRECSKIYMKNDQAVLQNGTFIDNEENKVEQGKKLFSLRTTLKIAAVISVAGGAALHFLGYVTHMAYLRTWGIDSDLFPKSIDWIYVNGYYTLFDGLNKIFTAFAEGWKKVAVLGLCSALYIFLLIRTGKKEKRNLGREWRSRLPEWLHDLLLSAGIVGGFALVIPLALASAIILLALPALLGESRGRDTAIQELASFHVGCENQNTRNTCLELRKDGRSIVRGFLIDSSESHIAIFDVAIKRPRIFERAGTEMIADPPRTPSNRENK
jgi:hypothetical protein